MESVKLPFRKKEVILALGAESAGVFAVYRNGSIFVSENFGDLLDDSNFARYKKAVLQYCKKEKIKPDVTLTDLHPEYKTTIFGSELAKKFKVKHIKIQHHFAHVFSSVGDFILNTGYLIPNTFVGLAMDGTGYGLDGNIWGSEIFRIKNHESRIMNNKKEDLRKENLEIERIGSLEEQIMIGGDLAVREPARMLISILEKLQITNYKLQTKPKAQNSNFKKEFIYQFVKKFYTRNEFELLYNQMEQNFNCQRTTSTGRVLDAVSVLLGFAGNERKYKHEAAGKLEENSSEPYGDIESRIMNYESRKILDITYLFEYLLNNINRDKKRLAATAQLYIARGLYEIIKSHDSKFIIHNSCFAAGGMANNKIIYEYLEKQGVYLSKKIPQGDEGIGVGQIIYYILNNEI